MLWIKSSALIMNLGWNRKVFVGDDLKKINKKQTFNCSTKILQTYESQSCHFTLFFTETSIELVSSSILSPALDFILHAEPVQICRIH